MSDVHPLELDPATVRAMVRDVLDRVLPWLERQADGPMTTVHGSNKVAAALHREWPETGTPWPRLLADLDRARGASLDTTSPGYLGYVPGGGIAHAAIADLYADLVNRFTGLWMPAPGFVTLEVDVLRWFARMVGYGDGAGGVLTSGGSIANLGGIVAARHKVLGDTGDNRFGRIYVSAQTHHSAAKAAALAGFAPANVVAIPVDDAHRLRPDLLDRAIRDDRAAGRIPVAVVASAGTTAVGAVDDLRAIGAVCRDHSVWLHVDGAYGGFFTLTERGRATLAGIDAADSIALDPHKGLFLPYGTGCVLARDREDLRAAHAVASAYLPEPADAPFAWDFADLGPELSRPFRGLRVWLPLALHGFAPFRAALDEKLDLAAAAAEAIARLPRVRLVSNPALSLFAFRVEPPGLAPGPTDALNKRWLALTNRKQRVFLSGATVFDPAVGRELFVARVCVLSYRTHADRMAMLVEDLAAGLAELDGSADGA